MRIARSLAVVSFVAALLAPVAARAITVQEVITLSKLGISESEIVKAIQKDQSIFNITVQDMLSLKQAGVPDGVIRFMMETPQRFGGGQAPAPVAPAPVAPAAPLAPAPVVQKSPEELAAEQERARQDALKMQDEIRRAQESQRKAFAQGRLSKAMELADDGEWVPAIQQFQDFLSTGGFGPGTEEYYTASFGIANALAKAGLYQSAAKKLVDVLKEGPERPFFQPAFEQLRTLRQRINYSPPDLEELTKFFVASFSRHFQDQYNYFLGEFFYDYNNFALAVKYLDQVSDSAADYAAARYLIGLVQVRNKMYKSAVESFQQAVLATERNESDVRIADNAYLALARIAYESGNYDGAIYYYKKIPQRSQKLSRAFYESAWTYFLKGDYSRAIGTFQVLHSPYFTKYFYPELWILEATVYLNMCHYELAKAALRQFSENVAAAGIPLKQFMLRMRTPKDYYEGFLGAVKAGGGQNANGLPAMLTYPVLSNVEFYNLYRTVAQIEKEQADVERNRSDLGQLGQQLGPELQALHQSAVNEIGIKIQQLLKEVDTDIEEYIIKVKEIEVDLADVEINAIDEQTADVFQRQEREAKINTILLLVKRKATDDEIIKFIDGQEVLRTLKPAEIEQLRAKKVVSNKVIEHLYAVIKVDEEEGGTIAIVGDDSLEWPFEGEYWRDEIGGFRSYLREACKK